MPDEEIVENAGGADTNNAQGDTSNSEQPPDKGERKQPQFVGSQTGQPITSTPGEGEPKSSEGEGDQDGEEKPVMGHGGKEMSAEAISDRVDRERKKLLRKYFGTDDETEAEKQLASMKEPGKKLSPDELKEFERLRRLEESRARARMTQEQRYQNEMKGKDDRIAELETEIKTMRTDAAVNEQDTKIVEAASKHIESKYLKYARRDLADELNEMKVKRPEQFKKFGDAQLNRWFEKYSKENPQFAKVAEDLGDPEKKPAVASTGTPPTRRVVKTPSPPASPPAAEKDGPGVFNGKTVTPGKQNSMSKAELRAHMKAQGRTLPY